MLLKHQLFPDIMVLRINDFAAWFRKALNRSQAIVFSCNCTISYNGRAESHLSKGDRIFLIKPDKTLIIHQPEGSSPVNYMKPGTEHKIVMNGKQHYLVSSNNALKEYMEILLNNVHFYNSCSPSDGQKITLQGTEKDMSDHMYQNPELVEQGFKPLSREEHTKYGFIDLFGLDRQGTLLVVECKRYNADLAAVTQLRRYVERVKKSKNLKRVRGMIAAPKISANALRMLTDWGYSFRRVHPPKRLKRALDQKKLGEF